MTFLKEHRWQKGSWWALNCEPLDTLSPRTLRELSRRGDQYTVGPGQTVLAESSTVKWVFLVLDGELALRHDGRDLQVLKAGCLYGGLEVLHRPRAGASLVARDVSRVLALPVGAYTGLVETHPDFGSWVLRALAHQLHEAVS